MGFVICQSREMEGITSLSAWRGVSLGKIWAKNSSDERRGVALVQARLNSSPLSTKWTMPRRLPCTSGSRLYSLKSEGSLYRQFVDYAVEEVRKQADLSPVSSKEEFSNMVAVDGTGNIENLAFESSKIRLFRISSIDAGESMQVLNVAIFARPEYDLPIFCADFFSTSSRNIIVLDLNPLYNTEANKLYKEKYYSQLLPLAEKYIKLLPWGDKITTESLQFFSPLVIWTRPKNQQDIRKIVFSAFQDYLQAWLNMMHKASPAAEAAMVSSNQECQHRYLSWRATKDPGRPLLIRLYGEQLCEKFIQEFLFDGLATLGSKCFLEYFPEYRGSGGQISKQRSMVGKSFASRPWDKYGNFNPEID